MSVVLSVMFLAYLFGIQATDIGRQQAPPTQDPINSLIIQLLQEDLTRAQRRHENSEDLTHAQRRHGDTWERQGKSQDRGDQNQLTIVGRPTLHTRLDDNFLERRSSLFQPVGGLSSDLLQKQKRFNSPRVLLSERAPLQPPPLYLIDDYVKSSDGVNKTRRKRYAEHKSYRGEYSVCDSESTWVTDKINAVDINGRQVTVLGKIKTGITDSSFVKQYFYETKCRTDKPHNSGCRGIDDKHWNSQCKTSQTYVRALTKDRTAVGWRWIRIDTSCGCALSRKHPARRKVT
ncbi:neurotrophin-3 isoform X2 [Esox lucius]|nr:neurotrophin-3 isoform X2 [Esox lucius]